MKRVYNIDSSFADTNDSNLNHILLSGKAILDIKCRKYHIHKQIKELGLNALDIPLKRKLFCVKLQHYVSLISDTVLEAQEGILGGLKILILTSKLRNL